MPSLYSMIPESIFAPVVWRTVGDSAKLLYLEMWGLATRCDARGSFTHEQSTTLTDDDIAFELRRDGAQFAESIKTLLERGLLARDDSGLYIPAFREANPTTQAERRRRWADNKRGYRQQNTPPDEPDYTPDDCPEDVPETSGGHQKESDALSIKSKELSIKVKNKESNGSNEPPTPSDPSDSKQKSKKTTADPRSSHVAIRLVHEITGKMPHKDIYDALIRVLGETPKDDLLRECWQVWRSRGYRPDNFAWALEWYSTGGPPKVSNQPIGQQRSQFQNNKPGAKPQVMYTDEQREAAREKARIALAARRLAEGQQHATPA